MWELGVGVVVRSKVVSRFFFREVVKMESRVF